MKNKLMKNKLIDEKQIFQYKYLKNKKLGLITQINKQICLINKKCCQKTKHMNPCKRLLNGLIVNEQFFLNK